MTASGIPAVLARGGSSRGLILKEADLAAFTEAERARLFARWVGSPDPSGRQVDGTGGGNATTSKVAVVAPSSRPGRDLDYRFHQIIVATGFAERRGTCGNLTTAVAQFAVDEHLVPAVEPVTTVRLYDVNTSRSIDVDVPVAENRVVYDGNLTVSGVPGTSAPVVTRFRSPGGAVTGRLLPTGQAVDEVQVERARLPVTLLDAVNPVALVHGQSLGLDADQPAAAMEADRELTNRLEAVRRWAAVACGLAKHVDAAAVESPFLPFVGVAFPPASYQSSAGQTVAAHEVDAVVRMLSGGSVHRALPLSAGLATAVAVRLGLLWPVGEAGDRPVRLGHPSGVLEAGVRLGPASEGLDLDEVSVTMTGRRILAGVLALP